MLHCFLDSHCTCLKVTKSCHNDLVFLQPPADVYCHNRVSIYEPPKVPRFFSYNTETITPFTLTLPNGENQTHNVEFTVAFNHFVSLLNIFLAKSFLQLVFCFQPPSLCSCFRGVFLNIYPPSHIHLFSY